MLWLYRKDKKKSGVEGGPSARDLRGHQSKRKVALREAFNQIQPVRNEFLLRFYRWALNDAEREIKKKFPFISRSKSALCLSFLEYMETLSVSERLPLGTALVKRTHSVGLALAKHALTQDEASLYARFLERDKRVMPGLPVPVYDLLSSRAEKERRTLPNDLLKIDRRKLRSSLAEKLDPPFGRPEKWPGSVWRYSTSIDGWLFDTYIDMGGKSRQVGYHHTLSAAEHVPSSENISILTWLGIGQTDIDLMTRDELEQSTQCIYDVCSYFFSCLPQLLDGLSRP